MGPLNNESRQTSSIMELEHGSTPTGGLRIHSDSNVNGVDPSTLGKNLRSSSSISSSSSPDSPFDNPFKEDENETKKYNIGTTLAKLSDDPQLASSYSETNVSGSLMPKNEQHNFELSASTLPPVVASGHPQSSLQNTSTTESPPIQAMERSGDSTYRIPDHVFSKTKSTVAMEWSLASNESLFSIHTDNTSFVGEPTTSQIFELSPNHTPINKPIDSSKSSQSNVSGTSVETMKEDIRKSEEDKSIEQLSLAPCVSNRSDISGTSVKSFAFPILTWDIGKGGSENISGSPRVGPEDLLTKPEPEPQQPPQTQQQLQPQESELKPETPSQPSITRTKWFACFKCCSFCSQ